MKIDLSQELFTLKGESLKVKENNEEKVAELKDFLENIALAEVDNDKKQKGKDFRIALKISNAEKYVELESKECSRLQQKVEHTHTALVYGQIYEILNGNENPLNPNTKGEISEEDDSGTND